MTHSADPESTQSDVYPEPTGSHQALFVVLEYWWRPENTRGRTRASAFRKLRQGYPVSGGPCKTKGKHVKTGYLKNRAEGARQEAG